MARSHGQNKVAVADMTAIPCASVSMRTMADGTLRLSIDIEPMHAQDAFKLFAAPGTPAAIAALSTGYLSKKDENLDTSAERVQKTPKIDNEKPKGGALAKLAGMWCNDPNFWAWLEPDPNNACQSANGAAACLYAICGIDSRAELDNDPVAAEKFHRLIRGPYQKYLIAKGVIA